MTLQHSINAIRLETPQRRAALAFESGELLETEENGWTVRLIGSGTSLFFPALCSSIEKRDTERTFTVTCPLWFALNYELGDYIQHTFTHCPVRRTKEI